MFSLIRLFIGLFIFSCLVAFVRKISVEKKQLLYIVSLVVSLVISVGLFLFPFENLFITFESPETVYDYVYFGENHIDCVVEGEKCGFIVGENDNSQIYLIIPKKSNGWGIGVGSDTRMISQKITNGIIVYLYQYKNTDEYFVTVLNTAGGQSEIRDSCNSSFYSVEKENKALGKTYVTYYAHISKFNLQYHVIVDGDKIVVA